MARKEVGDENSREREREREKGKGFGECPLPTELTHEVVRVRPGKAAGEVEGEGVGVVHGFGFGCDREVLRVCVGGRGVEMKQKMRCQGGRIRERIHHALMLLRE